MILAAGLGTRLLPLTNSVPKPMISIGKEALIVHQIRWLRRAGIREIVINVHHLAAQITTFLGTGEQLGVSLSFSHEPSLLDTGGAIVNVLQSFDSDPFIVLNGDVWTNFDFAKLADKTTDHAHLVLTRTPSDREHGDFELVDNIVKRHENSSKHRHTFSGISLLVPELFQDAPNRGIPFSLTRDLLFGYVQRGLITGEFFEGIWEDIGSESGLDRARSLPIPSK